jgi:hypothetical protein
MFLVVFFLSPSSFLTDSMHLSSYREEQICSPFPCQGLHHPILCIFFFETSFRSTHRTCVKIFRCLLRTSFFYDDLFFKIFPILQTWNIGSVYFCRFPCSLTSFAICFFAQDSAARKGCTWHMLLFQCRNWNYLKPVCLSVCLSLSVCMYVCMYVFMYVCMYVWGKTCCMSDFFIDWAKRNWETIYSCEITLWIPSLSFWKQRLLLIVQTSGPLEPTPSLLVYLHFR